MNALMKSSGVLALAAFLLIYPFVFSNAFYLNIGAAVLLAAISASAWNLVGGYAGQISVGHGMFFGAGAYAPLLLYHHWGWPPLAGVPAGIAVSLVLAILVGMPTFRLRGHYFSMATIAIAELIRIYVGTWDFVGAAMGLQGPAVGRSWWDLTFRDETPYYFIFLGVLAVLLYVTFELQRSRFGSYLRAIKADERAAASLGVSVRLTKLKALMLSAFFTSIAGSLYSIKTGFIDPESGFGILVSVQMVIFAALGGAGSLFGPLVGAVILVTMQTVTNTWVGGDGSGLTYILYGGIIVIISRFEPGGLYEFWRRVSPRLWGHRDAA
jgi:branched-chain amino acid transport system permease protein